MKGILALLMALGLAACGADWSVGPDDGGRRSSSFDERFRYYFAEDCRYDSFGPYDCSDSYSLKSSMFVRLSVTYDGYATLCVENDCSYYDPGEYSVGYDHGIRYYDFEGDYTRMTIYMDGSELVYIDYDERMAYYYYYDNPADYDYYY
jgi:hypothetical protein